jgi:hypothetical protein
MSIYGGFSSRQIEEQYNNALVRLLQLLQNQLLVWLDLRGEEDEGVMHFAHCFNRVVSKLRSLEERKYLPPKFSMAVGPLAAKLEQFVVDGTGVVDYPKDF